MYVVCWILCSCVYYSYMYMYSVLVRSCDYSLVRIHDTNSTRTYITIKLFLDFRVRVGSATLLRSTFPALL